MHVFNLLMRKRRVLDSACGCHVGLTRGNNEDNFLFDGNHLEQNNNGTKTVLQHSFELKQGHLFAVFDGMGGESSGEVASYIAAETIGTHFDLYKEHIADENIYLEEMCFLANQKIFETCRELRLDCMGCTIVSMLVRRGKVHICSIGDSSAYILSSGRFSKVTVDHVEAVPADSVKDGHKPGLTQFLGINPEELQIEPFMVSSKIKHEDAILLCSDGLTDMISEQDIKYIISNASNAKQCVETLIDTALKNGGKDNVTAIVCFVK